MNGITFGMCACQCGILTTVEYQCSTPVFKTAAFLHTGINILAETVRDHGNADADGAAFVLVLAVHILGVHDAEQVYVLCRRQGVVFTGASSLPCTVILPLSER
ncbi:MAG: hypothetical protein ACSLEN_14610 [Candidatus Malihini olakiniferum]